MFEEYVNLERIKLDKKEYGKIAYIINSKSMKKGRNTIYLNDYIYRFYWYNYNNWKIYDKILNEIEGEDNLWQEKQ